MIYHHCALLTAGDKLDISVYRNPHDRTDGQRIHVIALGDIITWQPDLEQMAELRDKITEYLQRSQVGEAAQAREADQR